MIVYSSRVDLEADLAAGRVRCPPCGGPLGPWGHARGRLVRTGAGSSPRWWRPRRGRCRSCGATQVLLAAQLLARRRDDIEVIGAALARWASGHGHRRVATDLGLPASTVRNWARRFAAHVEAVGQLATGLYYRYDANAAAILPAGSPAADAIEAIGQAARAARLRHGTADSPWALINLLTAGALLSPGRLPVR